MTVKEYVSKRHKIHAIQFTGDNYDEIVGIFGDIGIRSFTVPGNFTPLYLSVTSESGRPITCYPGDWIIPEVTPNSFRRLHRHQFEEQFEEPGPNEDLFHDEDTLYKVFESLIENSLNGDEAREIITTMQNKGILFREKKP